MERKPVQSSQISSIGYDPETNTLEVEFARGGLYQYHDVSPEDHAALIGAKSIGSHFHQNVRNAYSYTKVS